MRGRKRLPSVEPHSAESRLQSIAVRLHAHALWPERAICVCDSHSKTSPSRSWWWAKAARVRLPWLMLSKDFRGRNPIVPSVTLRVSVRQVSSSIAITFPVMACRHRSVPVASHEESHFLHHLDRGTGVMIDFWNVVLKFALCTNCALCAVERQQ